MRTVLVTGCFDRLHVGHVWLLEQAAGYGERLVVAINSDESVTALKGPTRPIFTAQHRAWVLRSFRVVHQVIIFPETTVENVLRAVRPAVWVKGGDWTLDTLNPLEVAVARALQVEIVLVPELIKVHSSDLA